MNYLDEEVSRIRRGIDADRQLAYGRVTGVTVEEIKYYENALRQLEAIRQMT